VQKHDWIAFAGIDVAHFRVEHGDSPPPIAAYDNYLVARSGQASRNFSSQPIRASGHERWFVR
jgi:hypothetical protein